MKRLLALILFILISSQAKAGMIWIAIAAEPNQITQLTQDEKSLISAFFQNKNENRVDLDKAWHGIHFLLTGTAWDTNSLKGQAILGGKEFGSEMGYGRARLLSADEVRKIADILDNENPQAWSKKFDAKKMSAEQIYPDIWDEGPDALDYLITNFQDLKAFYRKAADNGFAVIAAIM